MDSDLALRESPPAEATAPNLLALDRAQLAAFFLSLQEKSFRAPQLLQWIHQQGVTDFAAMSNISKSLRERLQVKATAIAPQATMSEKSRDGTRKWLVRVDEQNQVETVFIPDEGRQTLCVSTQAGCALHCSFCATGRQGFNRNLSAAEIIGQVWLAEHGLRAAARALGAPGDQRLISNVVFMGMGEPLLNFENVAQAIRILMDDFGYGLSWRRVTVSTAGVIPAMDRLREESPVALAVSLHAARDELRDVLVPLNRKYPIKELMLACRRYSAGAPRRRITFEYVLLDGVNDSVQDAKELVRLLRDMPAKVNLIPLNPFPGVPFQRPTLASIERFRDILVQAGIITITRKTRGDDIAAACGQLAGKVRDKTHRQARHAQAVQ